MDHRHLIHTSLAEIPPSAIFTFFTSVALVLIIFKWIVRSDDRERPVNFSIPIPEQCNLSWNGEILHEPSIKAPGSSAIRCYCPANGRLLGFVNPATPDGIDRAIAKAKAAQVQWAKTTFKQRRRVLRTLLKYILDHQDSLATVACLDSGKTKIDASLGEILVTVEKLKWTIEHGEKALRPERRPTNFLMTYKYNEVRWEPLGLVAACVSWKYFSPLPFADEQFVDLVASYPFHNFISPLISTLFTGSALVLKASENTAWSTQHFAHLVKAALKACGHSPDLIQPIVCWPPTANHLTSHLAISHITFIGSRPIAHHVASSAAKTLTPLCLELGGKDPAVILDDARNLDKLVSILMRGTFQSAGQNCIGIERTICLPSIYPRLIALLQSRIRALRVGSSLDEVEGVDVGAMITNNRFSHLESLIKEAVMQGARCLVGGNRYTHPKYSQGHYFSPTLLVDVTHTMRIAQEEVFAPICVVMRASSLSNAIDLVNSTPYALGASVFGTSSQDLEAIASSIHAGMVSINDFGVYYAVSLPFGGVKGSGYGRFGGEEGLRSLCNIKAVCRDRWPGLLSTNIPATLDYPVKSAEKGWLLCKGVIELGYAEGWKRVGGLWKILING
ncbi:MAG: hypothetical protein Q9217_000648 [Psora testacea]